ncbi:MAG: hypothetical protein PHR69_06175 [Sphaerochaeta sp.]|nr:hypothetical protein [Sphaerochaeta sp.]
MDIFDEIKQAFKDSINDHINSDDINEAKKYLSYAMRSWEHPDSNEEVTLGYLDMALEKKYAPAFVFAGDITKSIFDSKWSEWLENTHGGLWAAVLNEKISPFLFASLRFYILAIHYGVSASELNSRIRSIKIFFLPNHSAEWDQVVVNNTDIVDYLLVHKQASSFWSIVLDN